MPSPSQFAQELDDTTVNPDTDMLGIDDVDAAPSGVSKKISPTNLVKGAKGVRVPAAVVPANALVVGDGATRDMAARAGVTIDASNNVSVAGILTALLGVVVGQDATGFKGLGLFRVGAAEPAGAPNFGRLYAKVDATSGATELWWLNSASAAVQITGTDGGLGGVSAAAVIADNALVRGDGGVKGVQGSNLSLSDAATISVDAAVGSQLGFLMTGLPAANVDAPDIRIAGASGGPSGGGSPGGKGTDITLQAGFGGSDLGDGQGDGGDVSILASAGAVSGNVSIESGPSDGEVIIQGGETGGAIKLQTSVTLGSGQILSGSGATPWTHDGPMTVDSLNGQQVPSGEGTAISAATANSATAYENRVTRCTNAAGCNFTVNAGTPGAWVALIATVAGQQVTITAGAATETTKPAGKTAVSRSDGSPVFIYYLTATTYSVMGDLA